MREKIRYGVFIAAAIVILLVPLALRRFDEELALSGVTAAREFPEVTLNGLLSGEVQTELEEYVQQNLPGKPFLVRLRNQITFSLFHTSPNNNYSMNLDRNLFTWGNVSSYMQYNEPVSEEYVSELVTKLRRAEEILKENGMQLFLFVTPCKVRFCEEELPWVDKAMAPERGEGNYERLMKGLSGSGLQCFDSVAWLNENRGALDRRVPLFYRTSVHWSVYVGNCVGNAFGEFLEANSGYDLPEMEITARPCENPVYPDSDAFNTFNLLQRSYDQYYEPVIEITDEAEDAPNMLCRGGSFMGQTLSPLIRNHYFGKNVYMENAQIFTDEFGNLTVFHDYDEVDMKALFDDIDLVILEVNEPSIPSMSFGFIDYLLEHPEIAAQEE